MQSCIYESDYETFTTNLRKHEELNMKRRMIWIAPLAILAMVLFVTLGGYVVTHLWNWLLPGLFGWRQITFWQGLGLLHCAEYSLEDSGCMGRAALIFGGACASAAGA